MKTRLFSFFLLILLLAVSCPSSPKTQSTDKPVNTSSGNSGSSNIGTNTAAAFDPRTVTQQQYSSTMEEVQAFINELNKIIAARDYAKWRARLSREYFARISSQEFLSEVNEQPAMKTRRITLRSAEEYFIHVVVPSRQNSRVDTIEFVGHNKVIAYTVNTIQRTGEEVRLRLYDLEKVNNLWLIIN